MNPYYTHTLKGTVSWFNDASGEGVVRGDNGRNYYLHYSAIQSSDTRKTASPGQQLRLEVLDDDYARHITRCFLMPKQVTK